MTREELIEELEGYEDVMLADGFEDAFLGIAVRCASEPVAVYDYETCVRVLMTRDGMSDESAREWMEFNVVGAYVGKQTPWFLQLSLVEGIKKLSGVDMPIEPTQHLADSMAGGADEFNLDQLGAEDLGRAANKV